MDIPTLSRVPVSVIAPSVLRMGDVQMFFMVVRPVRVREECLSPRLEWRLF